MPIQSLPRIGLGTVSDEPEVWTEAIQTALELGYRHIDTAQMYGNEGFIGEGIECSNVAREDVFLATKTIYCDPFDDPESRVPPSADDVEDAIDRSLERLGVDYVDLCYVHWPGVHDHETVLSQFEQAYHAGKIHHLGVANFTPELIDEATDIVDIPIAAHQAELHPLLQQRHLIEHAQDRDYWLVAYCPIARGDVFSVPEIESIAEKHDVTPAQVSLAWLLSKDNVAVIPKSSTADHMRENLRAIDIELDPEDHARIESIDRNRRIVDPEYGAWNR